MLGKFSFFTAKAFWCYLNCVYVIMLNFFKAQSTFSCRLTPHSAAQCYKICFIVFNSKPGCRREAARCFIKRLMSQSKLWNYGKRCKIMGARRNSCKEGQSLPRPLLLYPSPPPLSLFRSSTPVPPLTSLLSLPLFSSLCHMFENTYFTFFSKFKKTRYYVFLKWHVKKFVENVIKVSEWLSVGIRISLVSNNCKAVGGLRCYTR